ncbi:hypothetical protein [Paenibacillus senegalensis]|uniref:hypothetical protein n=1 Tax=Paenibacillus senegalensis TaxID=1465766 RepID=UPI00028916D9|nr:hypothetical protein [Paenibacillus senegalensis]
MNKKLITTLLSIILLFSISSSAFANTSRQTADPISMNSSVSGALPQNTSHWYKWTNNTGSSVSFTALLQSPAGINYNLVMIHQTRFGTEITIPASDMGPGQVDGVQGSHVAPGETLFFQISGNSSRDYGGYYVFYLQSP